MTLTQYMTEQDALMDEELLHDGVAFAEREDRLVNKWFKEIATHEEILE